MVEAEAAVVVEVEMVHPSVVIINGDMEVIEVRITEEFNLKDVPDVMLLPRVQKDFREVIMIDSVSEIAEEQDVGHPKKDHKDHRESF